MRWIQVGAQGVGAIFKLVQDAISRVYPSYYPKSQNIVAIRGEDLLGERFGSLFWCGA